MSKRSCIVAYDRVTGWGGRRLPRGLHVVASLFLLQGILGLIGVLLHLLMTGSVVPNLGLLGLWIGHGLMKLRPKWHRCALVLVNIAVVLLPMAAALSLVTGNAGITVAVLGLCPASGWIAIAPILLLWGVAIWSYRVLTSDEVVRLFGIRTNREKPWMM